MTFVFIQQLYSKKIIKVANKYSTRSIDNPGIAYDGSYSTDINYTFLKDNKADNPLLGISLKVGILKNLQLEFGYSGVNFFTQERLFARKSTTIGVRFGLWKKKLENGHELGQHLKINIPFNLDYQKNPTRKIKLAFHSIYKPSSKFFIFAAYGDTLVINVRNRLVYADLSMPLMVVYQASNKVSLNFSTEVFSIKNIGRRKNNIYSHVFNIPNMRAEAGFAFNSLIHGKLSLSYSTNLKAKVKNKNKIKNLFSLGFSLSFKGSYL
jgi:hypothetical protein